nr:hypothetical protein [Tanacetum cinerariifolium]
MQYKPALILRRFRSTPSQEHQAKGGTSETGLDPDISTVCPEVLSQGATDPSHQGREIRKEKRCSKCWKMVYSKGLETREKMCPHTQMTQGVSRTIAVAEILRVVTIAPAQEEQSLLLRNIITKERPHTGRKLYQKARVAQKDTGSQDQRSKGKRKPRKGQNQIKIGQKREACRSREKFKAVTVGRGRKT